MQFVPPLCKSAPSRIFAAAAAAAGAGTFLPDKRRGRAGTIQKAPVPVKRIGINDVFGESGPAVALLEKYGLDAEGIYKQIKEFV